MRIIIIDDDEDFLEIMNTRLKKEGYEVSSLISGSGLRGEVCEFNPDLVITDILMPGITGAYVYEEIRKICGPDMPVIVSTATRMKLKHIKDDFLEYCPKPVDFDKLFETIQRLVSLSQEPKNNNSTQ